MAWAFISMPPVPPITPSPATSLKTAKGSAIANGGSNNDLVISANVILNTNTLVPGPAILLINAERVQVSGDNLSAAGSSPTIGLPGPSSVAVNSMGYNPVGVLVNPWPATGAGLGNSPGGSADPQTGVTYTVRQTLKTVVVAGGDVSRIAINGASTAVTSGAFN